MDEQAKLMVDESYTRTLELLEGKKEELVKGARGGVGEGEDKPQR